MEITANSIRLLAHVSSLGLVVAAIGALAAARGKAFNMRHWRVLVLSLSGYAVWFFMLALSIQDSEIIRRGEVAWLFGLVELSAAGVGWAWWALTMRASLCIAHPAHRGTTLQC